MKILDVAKRMIGRDVAKRAGVYVYRPVMNGAEWFAWATKWGVPEALAADDLHVTVIWSPKDVQMVPEVNPIVISTIGYDPGCFCLMGPAEESLVYCFDHYSLFDRNWAFRRNGAEPTWPTFRAHMTLTNAVAKYELSAEALADAPHYIVLGGEVHEPAVKDQLDAGDMDPEGEGASEADDSTTIIVIIEASLAAAEAKKTLGDREALKDLSPLDITALRDIAAEHPLARSVVKRLAKTTWAPAQIAKSLDPKKKTEVAAKKFVERDMVITMKALPTELLKSMNLTKLDLLDDEQRIVKGIASVSTVNGVEIEDLQGDTISTTALWEFNRSLLSGQRAGKFEHRGEVRTEIVAGLLLSDDWQRALGIDLGYEPLLNEIHVPHDEDWAEVKKGDWMLSIAAKVIVEVEEGAVS